MEMELEVISRCQKILHKFLSNIRLQIGNSGTELEGGPDDRDKGRELIEIVFLVDGNALKELKRHQALRQVRELISKLFQMNTSWK